MTSDSLLDLLDEHHGKRLDYEDLEHFDLEVSFGLTSDEVHRLLDRAHAPEVLEIIRPIPGCHEVLARWLDAGYEVDLLTGRPAYCAAPTRRWLDEHDFPYSNLFFVDKYNRAERVDPTGDAITLEQMREMEFVLAVEDSPQIAYFLAEQMEVEVALMDRPWNRDLSHASAAALRRLNRCRSWAEIAERYPAP